MKQSNEKMCFSEKERGSVERLYEENHELGK